MACTLTPQTREGRRMLACWRVSASVSDLTPSGLCCRAGTLHNHGDDKKKKKKVVVVGSGWSGLGAAHHLSTQGFDVTVIHSYDSSDDKTTFGCSDDVGIKGFWYPYRNIFSLVDELGIRPFTSWKTSAQYSQEGVEVEFPIFQDLPRLPTPLGPFFYPQFRHLSFVDRVSSLPLMAAVIDFDNTDTAWRKYDSMTARELLRQFGCSEKLYQDFFNPMLQVGLFAPAEQCSAANDFDVVWCRGSIKEKIFEPWMDSMRERGCKFVEGIKVTDFSLNEETGVITEVVCGTEKYKADAVVLAIGIFSLQQIVKRSSALRSREEFLRVLNLAGIDLLTVKLRLDSKVNIPKASNACFGFDDSSGWTFFDLNAIHDNYKDDAVTVLEADFDEQIAAKVLSYLSLFIKDFKYATVVEKEVGKFPKLLTHFFPGSYKYMMRGSTTFPNLFMAGDWIITRHGSWSQEKSYVTGLEAANRVVDCLEEGKFAKIIPVEDDELHVQALRSLNRNINEIRAQLPWSDYFLL